MAEEKEEVVDKKAEEKQRKKEEAKQKKAQHAAESDELEEESGGSKVAVFFVSLLIIVVWFAIIALLIKWDVGGFGSGVLAPILKDVPYVNKILPDDAVEQVSTEDSAYAYDTMADAVERIKELEKELADAQNASSANADDFWLPQKLEKQISFMKKGNYPFSFTSYEFADANAVRSGTVAHAPERVGYKEILKSSTIAPSTAVLDRNQVDTALIYMPANVRLEDAATWMQIMKTGITAYGLDEILTIYCRHKGAYSGNKLDAVWGKWKLYRNVEKFSFFKAAYYVCVNTWAAVVRRL